MSGQKLYIANTSKQDLTFTYSLARAYDTDGNPTYGEQSHFPPRQEKIPAGTQVLVTGSSMDVKHVNHIIAQNLVYGLKTVAEARKAKEFVGMCYSVGEPVKFDVFVERIGDQKHKGTNDEIRDKEAGQRLQETTAAIGELVQQKTGQQVTRTEVEQTEDSPNPKHSAGVEVVREGVQPRHKGKEGRGRQSTN